MIDPRMVGVSQEKLAEVQQVTQRVKAELRVSRDRLELRLLPQDEEAARHVPSLVQGVAQQVASFLYTYLAIKGEWVDVA